MPEKNIYHANCSRFGQHYLIETMNDGREEAVTNFVDITDEDAQKVGAGSAWPDLRTSPALRSCRWCGSREVGGCDCQQTKGFCPEQKAYRFQCLFCRQLKPVTARGDVQSLRLSVTSPKYDDIGPLLTGMGLSIKPFSQTGFDCDVLFINCGTGDVIDSAKLRDFVREGGCVYVSDLAERFLTAAFPGALTVDCKGEVCNCKANIVDEELRSIIGSKIEVCYDLSSWAMIRQHAGDVLIRGRYQNRDLPMMISFTEGEGRVFYTSFHNHEQASDKELAVLKLMLLRQIGSVCNQSITEVALDLNLNISDLSSLAKR